MSTLLFVIAGNGGAYGLFSWKKKHLGGWTFSWRKEIFREQQQIFHKIKKYPHPISKPKSVFFGWYYLSNPLHILTCMTAILAVGSMGHVAKHL